MRVAAETISAKSGVALSNQFGSGPVPAGFHASSDIEVEREKFDTLAGDLAVYAKALVSAAEQHPDAITPDMRMNAGDAGAGGPFSRKSDITTAVASMPAQHVFHTMF